MKIEIVIVRLRHYDGSAYEMAGCLIYIRPRAAQRRLKPVASPVFERFCTYWFATVPPAAERSDVREYPESTTASTGERLADGLNAGSIR